MKNILIVDDIPLIIKALKSLVNWDDNDFRIAGEAFDGVEAIKILEEINIDILITDIKMPVMDGLELIKYVREKHPNIKIIVMSSYDEFEQVRKSFKLGASDYLLKLEMDADNMMDICIRLKNEIDTELEQKNTISKFDNYIKAQKKLMEEELHNHKHLEKKLAFNKAVLRDSFFKEIIRGQNYTEAEFAQKKLDLDLLVDEGKYIIMLVCVENFKSLVCDKWDEDEELLQFSILNTIEESLRTFEPGDVFCINRDEYVVLLSYVNTMSWNEMKNRYSLIFNGIEKNLRNYIGVIASAGLSRAEGSVSMLTKMYLQAKEALRYRFIGGKGKLISCDEIHSGNEKFDLRQTDKLDYIRSVLDSLDPKVVRSSVDNLCIKDSEVPAGGMNSVREVYDKYSWILIDFIEENVISLKCEELIHYYNHHLWNMGSIRELNQWLSDTINALADSLSTQNSVVNLARQYIHKHFSSDISLKVVAEAINISSGHLSRIFLEKMNCNFVDYLNSYRIEKAKEYMKNSNLKIYEISEKVGYKNVEHFTRLFRRLVGKSPSEYASMRKLNGTSLLNANKNQGI